MSAIHAPMFSGGDPYWGNVVLLLNNTSAIGTVIDSSPYHRAFTNQNGASVDNTYQLNGLPTLNLTPLSSVVTCAGANDLVISGTYTVEFFINIVDDFTANPYFMGILDSSWRIAGVYSSGNNKFSEALASVQSIPKNTLLHIALSQVEGGTRKAFMQGVEFSVSTEPLTNTWNGTDLFKLGDCTGQGRNTPIYLGPIRFTKGVARYTTNFTPPTAPFPNS